MEHSTNEESTNNTCDIEHQTVLLHTSKDNIHGHDGDSYTGGDQIIRTGHNLFILK